MNTKNSPSLVPTPAPAPVPPAPEAVPPTVPSSPAPKGKGKAKESLPTAPFRLARLPDPAPRAADIVGQVVSVCNAVGLPMPSPEVVGFVKSFAGREAAMSLSRDGAAGKVTAKGASEAVAKFDWETVCIKAGCTSFLPSFVAGASLLAVAAKFRKASK